MSLTPATVKLQGSLANGQYTASPVTKADMGKTWVVNVVDGKGVAGQYTLIVPAICG